MVAVRKFFRGETKLQFVIVENDLVVGQVFLPLPPTTLLSSRPSRSRFVHYQRERHRIFRNQSREIAGQKAGLL
jgi:hypothetical protein